jgi:hypothetical protein
MPDAELAELVRRSLADETRETFEGRVDEQASRLREAIEAGEFDNVASTVGFELEAYAVDPEGRPARVPEAVFEVEGCNRELGLHNVEINTAATAFDADGVAKQVESLRDRVAAARRALEEAGLELVLDGMWTIPPAEGTGAYLADVDREDGVTVAANMRRSPRYAAIDNDVLARAGGAVELDLPGVRRSFPTVLVESLTTSIQPHLQVPDSATFPAHYAVGIRTLGPVLALATNSPFLPADLYEAGERDDGTVDPVDAPYELVERAYHEHRVPVFEQALNAGADDGKVRFPRDIERVEDVVDRLVADRTCAPFLKEWVKAADAVDGYADRIWELDHKRGTYWRWLRAVVGGEAVAGTDERSLRIEYRPVPTQPTVADTVGLQCLVSGLVRGLVAADHPLPALEWDATRRCFYDAVERGLDADLAWVDADGDRTDDPAVVYEEVFEYARRGLREQGLSAEAVDDYLAPVEARWTERTTPSRWKKRAVRERLDRGTELRSAIEGMQRAYVERSRSGEPFAEW